MVEEFMLRAGQRVRLKPEVMTEEERRLRARLIIEEVLETINKGLGIDVMIYDETMVVREAELHMEIARPMNMIELVDGCCDTKVVVTGTLSAAGIPDVDAQRIIDESNLEKFGPGGQRREDGKWVKPPNWQSPAPKIAKLLADLDPPTRHRPQITGV